MPKHHISIFASIQGASHWTCPTAMMLRRLYRAWICLTRRSLSPNGTLRFKLLPHKPNTDTKSIEMEVIGHYSFASRQISSNDVSSTV